MLRFVELQEVHKTTTGRGKPASVLLSIDQIAVIRPTQHFKETSITLVHGSSLLVEGGMSEVMQAIQDAERLVQRPA